MSNILNVRVRKLIKDDLLEYGKYLLGFFVLGFGVPLILSLLFGTRGNILFIGFQDVNIDIGDFGRINVEGLFNFFSFAFFVFFMFIGGIIVGAELPSHVRCGGARGEYFIATIITAVIVSLAYAPVLLLLNMVINLFVSSNSAYYNILHIGNGELSTLLEQFIMYVAIFLLGYCIPLIWQRVGWLITVSMIVIFVLISGILGWNFAIGFNVFNIVENDDFLGITWDFSYGFFGIVGLLMIAVLGSGVYLLSKDIPVKVR